MAKKKKMRNQIFKLEERVLFDGAAAAEIVNVVDNAGKGSNDANEESEQSEEKDLIANTVAAAGPVMTADPAATVQSQGKGLGEASSATEDPAQILIEGNNDFSGLTADVTGEMTGDVENFFSADLTGEVMDNSAFTLAEAGEESAENVLYVVDPETAEDLAPEILAEENVLVLDGEESVADQVETWLEEHEDSEVDSVKFVQDDAAEEDALAEELEEVRSRIGSEAEISALTVEEFQAELAEEDHSMVIFPDYKSLISVEGENLVPDADEVPEDLKFAAEADREELVIVNSSTAELDNVLMQLGDSRDVLVLDSASSDSAFVQIENFLKESGKSYDAVHILTHGNDRGLVLGSDFVTDADSFRVFADYIAPEGDLMLYGCNMASTDRGIAFLQNIADAAQAEVGASADVTGSVAAGGNWTLEYSSGAIETTNISLDSSWNYRLTTYTINGIDNAASYEYITWGDMISAVGNLADGDVVIISGSRTADSLTVNANFSIIGDGDATPDSITFTNGITINDGKTLTVGNNDGTRSVTVNGNITVEENAANAKLRVNASSSVIGNVTGVNEIRVFAGAGIEGNVTTSGAIILANTASVDGTLTLNDGASLTAGTIAGNGADITTLHVVDGSLTGKGNVTNLTFGDDARLTLNDSAVLNVTNTATVGSDDTVTMNNGSILNLTASLSNNGTLAMTNATVNGTVEMSGGSISGSGSITTLGVQPGSVQGQFYVHSLAIHQGGVLTLEAPTAGETVLTVTEFDESFGGNPATIKGTGRIEGYGALSIGGGSTINLLEDVTLKNMVANATYTPVSGDELSTGDTSFNGTDWVETTEPMPLLGTISQGGVDYTYSGGQWEDASHNVLVLAAGATLTQGGNTYTYDGSVWSRTVVPAAGATLEHDRVIYTLQTDGTWKAETAAIVVKNGGTLTVNTSGIVESTAGDAVRVEGTVASTVSLNKGTLYGAGYGFNDLSSAATNFNWNGGNIGGGTGAFNFGVDAETNVKINGYVYANNLNKAALAEHVTSINFYVDGRTDKTTATDGVRSYDAVNVSNDIDNALTALTSATEFKEADAGHIIVNSATLADVENALTINGTYEVTNLKSIEGLMIGNQYVDDILSKDVRDGYASIDAEYLTHNGLDVFAGSLVVNGTAIELKDSSDTYWSEIGRPGDGVVHDSGNDSCIMRSRLITVAFPEKVRCMPGDIFCIRVRKILDQVGIMSQFPEDQTFGLTGEFSHDNTFSKRRADIAHPSDTQQFADGVLLD